MKNHLWLFVMGLLFMAETAYALSDDNRPEYKKEFDAYVADLNIIAQTGKAPRNPDLEADLAKMNSNERILLTASRNKSSDKAVLMAQDQNAQIVNSVEIIRVPEEFQKEYANVYKEEKQTVSAKSLVGVPPSPNFAQQQDPASKILNHINPFRFLKEVALTPLPKGIQVKNVQANNPMVDAYFNQFGRPYVSGASAAPAKEPEPSQPKPLGNLGLRNSMIVD